MTMVEERRDSSRDSHSGAIPHADAEAIIRRHQRTAPVDILAIARDMGVAVYTDMLGPEVSGLIRRDQSAEAGPSGYLILVNQDHPLNRKRFTVAHEIAHFVLHCGGPLHGNGGGPLHGNVAAGRCMRSATTSSIAPFPARWSGRRTNWRRKSSCPGT